MRAQLSSAGNLKRSEPDAPEDLVVLRALCDCDFLKFLADDVPLFNGIVSDLFPGTEQLKINYGQLLEMPHKSCHDLSFRAFDLFVKKYIQLYETTVDRHGLMLVGPTGGGKTICHRVLAAALRSSGRLSWVSYTGWGLSR
jgi:dynein heavy chain